jgi:hypothetical protein
LADFGFFIAISRVKQYNDVQLRGINMRNGGQGRPILKVEGMKYLLRQGDMGVLCRLRALYNYISLSKTRLLLIAMAQSLRANSAVIKYFSSIFERIRQ